MSHPNEIEHYRKEYESFDREKLTQVLRSRYSDDPRYIAANNLLIDLREKEAIAISNKAMIWSKIAGIAAIAGCIIALIQLVIQR